jgi:hypothetical protein
MFHQPSEKTLKLPGMAYAIATTASSESLLQMVHIWALAGKERPRTRNIAVPIVMSIDILSSRSNVY